MMTPPRGSTHHCGKALVMKIMGTPSSSPKKKPKFWMKRSSFLPTSRNIRLARVRVGLDVADHHQLHVQQLIYVLADLVGHRTHHAGQLLLDAGVDGVADELGQA